MDIAQLAQSAGQAAESARAATQLNANFDTFLTLLTTQLRNQDPLEPLDTERFTEQLVQFSNVEQSIQTNQNLEALIALQSAAAGETAIAAIGRIATVNADAAALSDAPASWTYTLPRGAQTVALNIIDEAGRTVASLEGARAAGAHALVWNGETASGARAPAGTYRLAVAATDEAGAAVNADIAVRGRVDAVLFDAGAPRLQINGSPYALGDVARIDANQ